MIFITRKIEFSAGHRLFNSNFSDEKNEATFGLCNNPNGHGHNYALEVTLSGEVNEDTGMVFDLKELKKLTQREIIDKVDPLLTLEGLRLIYERNKTLIHKSES